ncbi:MAG TPA: hypothetical protein VHO49_04800 [Anaerolineales bacterium]|nr:hypothetical protein [Anaerolineales bacterium]
MLTLRVRCREALPHLCLPVLAIRARAVLVRQFVEALRAQERSAKRFHVLSEGFSPSREAGLPAEAA